MKDEPKKITKIGRYTITAENYRNHRVDKTVTKTIKNQMIADKMGGAIGDEFKSVDFIGHFPTRLAAWDKVVEEMMGDKLDGADLDKFADVYLKVEKVKKEIMEAIKENA